MECGNRRRFVERLARLPRPAAIARGELQVAPRHVQPDRVAEHVIERRLARDVHPAPCRWRRRARSRGLSSASQAGSGSWRRSARSRPRAWRRRTAARGPDRSPSRGCVRRSCARRSGSAAPDRSCRCPRSGRRALGARETPRRRSCQAPLGRPAVEPFERVVEALGRSPAPERRCEPAARRPWRDRAGPSRAP